MKVGIMTMHRITNYGSFLQAYGLKRMIESLGHQVVFVDYKVEPSVENIGTIKANRGYIVIKQLWREFKKRKNKAIRIFKREKNCIADFVWEFEKHYLKMLGISKWKKYRSKVDTLVIGSDEVFNCTQGDKVGFSKELFGTDSCADKVISYAASFGNTTLEKLDRYHIRETVKNLLGNFSSISVRDKNSYKIVKELTGKEPEIHLDPVLIYNFADDIEDNVTEKDYIIVYAYHKRITKEEGEAICTFARKNQKKLIAISGEQSFCDEYVYCEPLKMLSYFKHADYVITDTFHGTIFSIINHRQFATLIRKDGLANGYGNSEKLGDLLEKLGLKDKSVENISDLEKILNGYIDYDMVDYILNQERVRAKKYLEKQL